MRPSIHPLLLAQLVDLVPSRVRKRLDSDPAAAHSWLWQPVERGWTILANDETVQITCEQAVVSSLTQLACSCLLSPKCFHILACCSSLAIHQESTDQSGSAEPTDACEPTQADKQSQIGDVTVVDVQPSGELHGDAQQLVEVTVEMRSAALTARESTSALLAVGARNAGLLLQSSLLRSAHACRAADLYTLGNTLLRIAEGVQRFRHQSNEADSVSLREDVAAALLTCHSVLQQDRVPPWVIGQARRAFHNIDVRKLVGVFAEPILTRSGFAGVTVYLHDTIQDRLFTVNELRTGDGGLIRQAYRGGIDLGGMTLDAKTLCRSSLSVQGLTASEDGRLGKGKSTRWATAKSETHQCLSSGRFADAIDTQLKRMLKWSKLPDSQRPPGWDLVSFNATILGAHRSTVAARVEGQDRPWQLCIAIDSPELEYRHNLELLCRCTRFQARCLARIRLTEPLCVDWLAVANGSNESSAGTDSQPHLDLPDDWQGVCNLGLDHLERHYVRGIERFADDNPLDGEDNRADINAKYTSPLVRRLVGMVLGGRDAIPVPGSQSHRRDHAQLKRLFLVNAGSLLDELALKAHADVAHRAYDTSSPSAARSELTHAFLACDAYVKTVQQSLAETLFNG